MSQDEQNLPVDEDNIDISQAKKGKLKFFLIVIVAVLIGVGGGAFLAVKFLAPKGVPTTASENGEVLSVATQNQEVPNTAKPIPVPGRENSTTTGSTAEGGLLGSEPHIISFDPFIVNLADTSKSRYLKITVAIEADSIQLAEEIQQKTIQIRDLANLLLANLTSDDISSMDGRIRLRNQLINRVNDILVNGKIKNIYFPDFVIQ